MRHKIFVSWRNVLDLRFFLLGDEARDDGAAVQEGFNQTAVYQQLLGVRRFRHRKAVKTHGKTVQINGRSLTTSSTALPSDSAPPASGAT